MSGLRAKLPPVNSLVVFEAAGRHLNFTRAAQELSVTQAAAGTHLFKSVTMGLEHIAATVTDIRRVGEKADVTVATSVTFASYWLMAHIAKFRAVNPDVE